MAIQIRSTDLLGKTPAPVQLQVLNSRAFEIGLITGFAAGKTRAICAATMTHALRYPNSKILIGRKTFQEMRDTVKQPWFQMANVLKDGGWIVKPKNWDYREGTHHAQLINGSQFFFSNFDDPLKFRNEEYSMVVIDQTEEVTEELWELILGRIRHKLVPPEGWQAIAAANDNGHNWMWRRFVYDIEAHKKRLDRCPLNEDCMFLAGHPDDNGDAQPLLPCSTRQFYHGTTLDNRHNLTRLYLANLLAKPKEWQKHFIYATMEGGAGRLLPDPTVVPAFEPPAEWPRYRAIDHALNSPCCCVWIAVNNGNATVNGVVPNAPVIYREYWQDHSSVDQHVERILKLSQKESIACTIIDKSAFRRDQSRKDGVLISIADLYAEYGLFCIPSQGDPFPRVERITTWHNKGMVITENCPHLIRSFPEYYAEQDSNGNYNIKNRSDFHAIDALGYGLMAVPQAANQLVEQPDGVPDYLRRKDGDLATERHNIQEWKRIKRIQDTHNYEKDSIRKDMVPAGEFWGEQSLDNPGQVGAFDPYGGDWN